MHMYRAALVASEHLKRLRESREKKSDPVVTSSLLSISTSPSSGTSVHVKEQMKQKKKKQLPQRTTKTLGDSTRSKSGDRKSGDRKSVAIESKSVGAKRQRRSDYQLSNATL